MIDPNQPNALQGLTGPVEIRASDLAAAREKLASIESTFGAIVG